MEIVVPDDFKYLYEVSAVRPVVKIPAEVLRQTAAPISRFDADLAKLADRMKRMMQDANGIGLAAPQIGISSRMFIMAPDEMAPLPVINPRILESSGSEIGQEGCLSIPGLYGDVERFARIILEGQDIKGRTMKLELVGLAARVAQHELDHLDGILFIDKVDFATLHWMNPEHATEG